MCDHHHVTIGLNMFICEDCGWQITPSGARVAPPIEAGESVAARKGRLVQLNFKRSLAARRDALASIRPLPNGRWSARIGGRMRGSTRVFWAKDEAERAVHAYYSVRLLEALQAINRMR